MVWNRPARNKIAAVKIVSGSIAARKYRLMVRKSKIMIMFFRRNLSASLPPRSAAGKERTDAVAISRVDVPSDSPSFAVRKKVSMGQTKEPIAVTSFPTNKIYISFFNPAYWVSSCFMLKLHSTNFKERILSDIVYHNSTSFARA